MDENLRRQLAMLPDRLGQHILISAIALAIGIGFSVPLAICLCRRPRLKSLALGIAGVVQTIPSLALLALMVPAFALLGNLTGLKIPLLGFCPAVTALTLYSVLPVLRNTVIGIGAVDADVVEAARGIGMTPWQQLVRVELPLAAPVIVGGIRTAAVWVIGIATLSTPIGQTSLGNYIFSGLQTQNWTAVVVGCAAAAVLAIVLDSLIGLMELAAARRNRKLAGLALGVLGLVVAGGLMPLLPPGYWRGAKASPGKAPEVVIGSKNFTEQYILADLLQDDLRDRGFQTRNLQSLGSTVIFDALRSNKIDVYVDYSGTIWANRMKRADAPGAASVLRQAKVWLRDRAGVLSLGPLGFENAYVLAMRRDRARQLGIATVADLALKAPSLRIGSDYEFFSRPEWRKLRAAYDLNFAGKVSLDPTFMYDAVKNRDVDVITAFSTDGRIAAYNLKVLRDNRHAFPPYDAVVLLSPAAARRSRLIAALRTLIGKIPVAAMRQANRMVDVDRKPVAVAARWLHERIK